MSYFKRKGDDSEYPERIVAVPESDYERKLRDDPDFEEIDHDQLKSELGPDFDAMPQAVREDAAPKEHAKVPREAAPGAKADKPKG